MAPAPKIDLSIMRKNAVETKSFRKSLLPQPSSLFLKTINSLGKSSRGEERERLPAADFLFLDAVLEHAGQGDGEKGKREEGSKSPAYSLLFMIY